MRPALRLGFMLLLLMVNGLVQAAPVRVTIATTENEKQQVNAFLNGRSPLQVDSYKSTHLDSIGTLEHILFRKAVLLGGLDAYYEEFVVPNSVRARLSVFNGSVLSSGTAQWHIYLAESRGTVLESDVVIPSGISEKGLYVTKERLGRVALRSREDLQKLRAVTSDTWAVDWSTLAGLKLAALYSAPTRPLQFKMIEAARADFTLQDFSGLPDLSIEVQGIRLYPIPGVKIALTGCRHFFINKNHPDGRVVFESLQKGLNIMQHRGEIKRALVESGCLNKAVADWILLNP